MEWIESWLFSSNDGSNEPIFDAMASKDVVSKSENEDYFNDNEKYPHLGASKYKSGGTKHEDSELLVPINRPIGHERDEQAPMFDLGSKKPDDREPMIPIIRPATNVRQGPELYIIRPATNV